MTARIWLVPLLAAALVGPAACGQGDEKSEAVTAAASRPTEKPKPDPNQTDSPDEGKAVLDAKIQDFYQRYDQWLRSGEVRKLDLRSLPRREEESNAPIGGASFEEAVDNAQIVVSGTVRRLILVPRGILALVKVDRTAKGEVPQTILVYQNSYIYPEPGTKPGTFGPAYLSEDPTRPTLFVGDRAVLLMDQRKLNDREANVSGLPKGTTVHGIYKETGEFAIEDGRLKSFSPRVANVKGMPEEEAMNRAVDRARMKKGVPAAVAPSPPALPPDASDEAAPGSS